MAIPYLEGHHNMTSDDFSYNIKMNKRKVKLDH